VTFFASTARKTWRSQTRACILHLLFPTFLLAATASTGAAATVTATWNANPETDIAGYKLSYGTASAVYSTTVDVGNVTSYQMVVPPGMTYYFAVRAYNTSGVSSGYSAEIVYTAPEIPVLSAQGGLSPAVGAPGTVVIFTGTGFGATAGTSTISFNGTAAQPLVWSSTSLAALVPLGATTGNVVVTTAGGTTSLPFTVLTTFPARTANDFNGDGKVDLLLRNDTTHQVQAWYMGGQYGNVLQAPNWLDPVGQAGWTVVAQADFDGDGKPDLVWQNDTTRQVTVWYMGGVGGNVFQSVNWLSSANNPGWSVVAVADFNGDGKPDLVWQNDTTRQVLVWYMGGAMGNNKLGQNWLDQNGEPGWTVVGAADYNKDGKTDIVWLNDTTRQATVWYFNGPQGNVFQGVFWLDSVGEQGWKVVAAGDLNGDGVPDLVWQNDATRQITVWYMGGLGGSIFQGYNYIDQVGMPGWRVVGF
jgi:hypothetical protein